MARGHPNDASRYGSIDITVYPVSSTNAVRSSAATKRTVLGLGLLAFLSVAAAVLYGGSYYYNSDSAIETNALTVDQLGSAHSHGHSKHDFLEDDEDGKELFYHDQPVNHFDATNKHTFSHRYYKYGKHFAGPGHPIFLVIGGEGPLEKLLYPFVNDHLAKTFGAYVLQPEHRFYGKSQPIKHPSFDDLYDLLTPEQAMQDMIHLVKHVKHHLGCHEDRDSKKYCPIITVGGSYPGFLSAMMRFLYPDTVDIGYASSAPLYLYAQELDPYSYYEKVTDSAERASAGCANAIRTSLTQVNQAEYKSVQEAAEQMGICSHSLMKYMDSVDIFKYEIMYLVPSIFADYNMENYPPTQDTLLAQSCRIFQQDNVSSLEKLKQFWSLRSGDKKCFDLGSELPKGPNATISTSDWTGAGDGYTGEIWEFQCCKDLIIQTGYSSSSMFVPREWTMEWLTQHCYNRFQLKPEPYRMVQEWGFDDLVAGGASRILFTNGLNDGWSVVSILEDLVPDSIVALNFENGAHHSDLSHEGPSDKDTDDIQAGFVAIKEILEQWLGEINGS